ncbi:hypothetical protein [Anaerocolumna cellulosilytica]|nr:hypothetical protein [Anaerocolumna cellulosilytica]MBB5196798.1 hypothetical protein [Anaerocolumna cellulosilytica]
MKKILSTAAIITGVFAVVSTIIATVCCKFYKRYQKLTYDIS